MRVENMNKNFKTIAGLGLTLLMSASIALVQGCYTDETTTTGTDKDKGDKEVKAQKLTFSDAPVEAIKGKNDKTDFSAIGTNGDAVYYGVDTAQGVVSIYNPNDGSVSHVELLSEGLKAGDTSASPAKASFQQKLTVGTNDKAVIKKILPGPGNTVVLSVRALGGRPNYPNRGGVAVVSGDKFTAGYRVRKEYMPWVTNYTENEEISALAVVDNNWVAFMGREDGKVATAGHAAIGTTEVAKVGPKAKGGSIALGKVVKAVAVDGTKIYALADDKVYSIDASDLDKAEIDWATPIVSLADLGFPADFKETGVISSLGVVDGKLLVGLNAFLKPDKKDTVGGGVLVVDAAGNKTKQKEGLQVRSINVSADKKSALIVTNKGLVYHSGDKFVAPTDKADANTVGFTNAVPEVLNTGNIVGATNVGNKWYIAVKNEGVFTLDF